MPRGPVASASPNERMKPSIYLDFGKSDVPKDFATLSIGDDVVVILRGKVVTLNQYVEGSAMSVEYTQLEVIGEAKPKTMQDALNAMRGDKG